MNTISAKTKIESILDSVNDDMMTMGFRQLKPEDIQIGLIIVRVEVHRLYARASDIFEIGMCGTSRSGITAIHDNMIMLENQLDLGHDAVIVTVQDLSRCEVGKETTQNDVRYYVPE